MTRLVKSIVKCILEKWSMLDLARHLNAHPKPVVYRCEHCGYNFYPGVLIGDGGWPDEIPCRCCNNTMKQMS